MMETALETAFLRPVSGAPINAYPSGLVPSRCVLHGRFIRLEPLDPAAHAEELYSASHGSGEALHIWDYLPHGPWSDQASFAAHLRNQAGDLDMIRFVLRPASIGTASGMASFMDINAKDGVIEIGGIWFSLALQRTRAATEALFYCSLMRWTSFVTGACNGAVTR
jgi:RimJ/RimL family protein N-acetyltransferase